MSQPFYGEQAKPDLPADRVRAAITILTLANAHTSFSTLLAAMDPALRPSSLAQVVVKAGDWTKLIEARDQAMSTLTRIEGYLDRFSDDCRPTSVNAAKERFSCLDKLAKQHRNAQISGYLTTIKKDDVDRLLTGVERRRDLRERLAAMLGADAADAPDALRSMMPIIEAARRLTGRGLESTAAAKEYEKSKRAGEVELLERLGRLSSLPGKLDVKGMTLGEAQHLANACDKIGARGERVALAMREPGIEDDALIANLAARRDKILNAGRILDDRFGTAWRLQPTEKLGRAAEIANTPGDPRHANVFEYARSFGIDAKIPQSLDGAAKTHRATERLRTDAALLQAFPTNFKGLDTDLDLLREAAGLVDELRSDLARVRGGAALLAVFRTNSRRVMAEFVGYANLHIDVAALGYPPETPIEDVYGLYRNDLVELREDLELIKSSGRDVTDLNQLAELAETLTALETSLVGNDHYIACGAYHPEEIPEATKWVADIAALTGDTPHGDEELARLAVVAHDAQQCLAELTLLHNRVGRALGHPDQADITFSSLRSFLVSIDAAEQVFAARALVCRSAEDADRSGLLAFISEVASITPTEWSAILDERYNLLDRLMADDAFAMDLSAAADAAIEAAGASKASPVASPPDKARGWVEEDMFLMPAVKQIEAA